MTRPATPYLKKRLGQHHLLDGRLCGPLLEFLEPAGARVVEIGPGGGVLTAELLDAGARVIGLELDREWAFVLRRRHPECRVVVADALEFAWERLPAPTLVAGNLPFNVATPILERLLPHHRAVPRAAFMVQKEVAERLVARPGDGAYGALSVLVRARAEAKVLGRVKPGSFRPPPKVAAAFVGLELHPPPVAEARMGELESLVRLAFGQRRKTLRNALGAAWGREIAADVLRRGGWDEKIRAEALDLADFVELLVWRT